MSRGAIASDDGLQQSTAPTSLRAILERAVKEKEAVATDQDLDAVEVADEKPKVSAQLVGSAERLIGYPPIDCQTPTRVLAAGVLAGLLSKELAAIVAEFAPFCGTEDLPLAFAHQAEEDNVNALAVDDWRDLVYVACGAEIHVYDALGHNGTRFAEHVSFAGPILDLALSAFPHETMCVLDARGVKLVSTIDGDAATVDVKGSEDLGSPTSICVDAISGRLFIAVGASGIVRLLPSVAELVAASGVIEWEWLMALPALCTVRALAFAPTLCCLLATTDTGAFYQLHVGERVIANAAALLNASGVPRCALTCDGGTPYLPEFDLAALRAPSGLCVEARSGHIFVAENASVAELENACLIHRVSGLSDQGTDRRSIAINERRRILYVASARRVQAFEIAGRAWRLSPIFFSDCAAAHIGDALRSRPVGFNAAVVQMLKADATAGFGSAVYDASLSRIFTLPMRKARRLRDQRSLGPFYALELSRAQTAARRAACFAGLVASGLWTDDYANPTTDEPSYVLRAFERGVLWATVYVAGIALLQDETKRSFNLVTEAQRVLRTAVARGDELRAGPVLACHLLASTLADERAEGSALFLEFAQVKSPFPDGLWPTLVVFR